MLDPAYPGAPRNAVGVRELAKSRFRTTVGSVAGAYVATGHGLWGMLNAPATGLALAELIVDGRAKSVDLRPFDPARLPPSRT